MLKLRPLLRGHDIFKGGLLLKLRAYEAILVGHFLKNRNFQKSWNFKIQKNAKKQMMNIKNILLDCQKFENCEICEKEAKNVKIDVKFTSFLAIFEYYGIKIRPRVK